MTRTTQRLDTQPEIRNQQVVSSSLTAGSIESTTCETVGMPGRIRVAYRVAYAWIRRLFGVTPTSRLQPFTDDLDTEQRVEELTRRIRG